MHIRSTYIHVHARARCTRALYTYIRTHRYMDETTLLLVPPPSSRPCARSPPLRMCTWASVSRSTTPDIRAVTRARGTPRFSYRFICTHCIQKNSLSHVCMYVRMHIYPIACMHVCVYAYLSYRMHACMCVCIPILSYACTCMNIDLSNLFALWLLEMGRDFAACAPPLHVRGQQTTVSAHTLAPRPPDFCASVSVRVCARTACKVLSYAVSCVVSIPQVSLQLQRSLASPRIVANALVHARTGSGMASTMLAPHVHRQKPLGLCVFFVIVYSLAQARVGALLRRLAAHVFSHYEPIHVIYQISVLNVSAP